MIEFIRRSLIQKAIEGDMKILAAGSLGSKSNDQGTFTVAEGKTTLTICYCNHLSGGGDFVSGYPFEGILKGQGTLYYNYSYNENLNEYLAQEDIVTITSNTIKNTSNHFSGAVNYIIFEIDE